MIGSYIKSCGVGSMVLVFLFYLLFLAGQAGGSIWLNLWSEDKPNMNGTQDTGLRDLRLGVYGGLGVAQGSQSYSSFKI